MSHYILGDLFLLRLCHPPLTNRHRRITGHPTLDIDQKITRRPLIAAPSLDILLSVGGWLGPFSLSVPVLVLFPLAGVFLLELEVSESVYLLFQFEFVLVHVVVVV